jgi:Asp-tRNA(Asn)/Glu-tRNA(Gln) amidotransferase A subunit family amidase
MLGLPAITLPSGLSEERLPFAIQLVGAVWD